MIAIRPLLASYGGGHAQIIAALSKAFSARGDCPEVVGFTTAYRELIRQGVNAQSTSALLEPKSDREWLALAGDFIGGLSHPDISPEDTRAYFALGLRDLVLRIGRDQAIKLVSEKGRHAFEPVESMRRYLRKTCPDIVITTTSPRFELALLKAARLEGIPHLAIGDLFLVKERAWIMQPNYAEYLAVLSSEIAQALISDGVPKAALRVTGNPAFDRLVRIKNNGSRRNNLRAQLGIKGKTVILFPAPGGDVSMIGRPFLNVDVVVSALEKLCGEYPHYSYLIRSHPNRPFDLPEHSVHGQLDNGSLLSAEDAILISDIVCVEASTMGLQAALAGRTVICVGFADYVLYPEYGLAHSVKNIDDAINLIRDGCANLASSFDMPELGKATSNVLSYVDDILYQKKQTKGKLYGES